MEDKNDVVAAGVCAVKQVARAAAWRPEARLRGPHQLLAALRHDAHEAAVLAGRAALRRAGAAEVAVAALRAQVPGRGGGRLARALAALPLAARVALHAPRRGSASSREHGTQHVSAVQHCMVHRFHAHYRTGRHDHF